MKPLIPITNQLNEQNIDYEVLHASSNVHTDSRLKGVKKAWIDTFIGARAAPFLDKYMWHIFSYNTTNHL